MLTPLPGVLLADVPQGNWVTGVDLSERPQGVCLQAAEDLPMDAHVGFDLNGLAYRWPEPMNHG